MLRSMILAAALAAGPALAGDLVARQGEDSVRLTDAACANAEVLALVDQREPGFKEEFRRAVATFQGQTYEGCWHRSGDGAHLIYSDGDEGTVPMQALKPVLDI